MSVITQQFFQDDEGTHLVEVDADKNQSTKEVHTLTVTNFWTMLSKRCENIEERILLRFDRCNELSNLPSCERPLDIKTDLFMHPYIVHCALFEVKCI